MGHIRVGYGKRSSPRSTSKGSKEPKLLWITLRWYFSMRERTSSIVQKFALLRSVLLFKSPVKTVIKKDNQSGDNDIL